MQKEQIAEELSNMKKRFDTYILDTQARLLEERESVRRESQMMIDTINKKVCVCECLEMSENIDTVHRETVVPVLRLGE